ncbi:hypothetical protein Tco_0574897 [Tanacetum coccineum]
MVYDEASPSYDSDILSEVHDHDHYQDAVCEHHEVHEMHDDVQPNYVVDSHADYTSDSIIILYNQYVKDNAVPVVQSNVSSVPNDAYMMMLNDMKASKEKVEDKLYKQDQSLQTVHMLWKPKPYYDEQNKIAIGYKNPLCLTRAQQVQPALYNGHEIFKTNHVLAIVHNSEDTLEIAEITRKKMNDKMKDPEWERGFEQTKECYLTEVIPFFKTLKEQFEGIQKALTKEIKEIKDIFEELEAEVDKNVVNKKHDEIEQKNLLIANDNLIVDCLSKEVFYVATNSELTVSRFTEMHEAHTIVQRRCLELKEELSKL